MSSITFCIRPANQKRPPNTWMDTFCHEIINKNPMFFTCNSNLPSVSVSTKGVKWLSFLFQNWTERFSLINWQLTEYNTWTGSLSGSRRKTKLLWLLVSVQPFDLVLKLILVLNLCIFTKKLVMYYLILLSALTHSCGHRFKKGKETSRANRV